MWEVSTRHLSCWTPASTLSALALGCHPGSYEADGCAQDLGSASPNQGEPGMSLSSHPFDPVILFQGSKCGSRRPGALNE